MLEIGYPNCWIEFLLKQLYIYIYILYLNQCPSPRSLILTHMRKHLCFFYNIGKHGMIWEFHQEKYGEIGQQV
jgi:hypothetical protein